MKKLIIGFVAGVAISASVATWTAENPPGCLSPGCEALPRGNMVIKTIPLEATCVSLTPEAVTQIKEARP